MPLTRHAFALRAEFTIGPAFGRTRWAGDLSPQAGRGEARMRHGLIQCC
jgi:hypothetical protein